MRSSTLRCVGSRKSTGSIRRRSPSSTGFGRGFCAGWEGRGAPAGRRRREGKMAGLTGLEPATSCVTGRRSNRLNYNPAVARPRLGRGRWERGAQNIRAAVKVSMIGPDFAAGARRARPAPAPSTGVGSRCPGSSAGECPPPSAPSAPCRALRSGRGRRRVRSQLPRRPPRSLGASLGRGGHRS
jgi:hypothetical protein